jgi:large subunit ribosomal protein L25
MSTSIVLHAETRSQLGTGASRRLRHGERLPGILYGGQQAPKPLVLSARELSKALENEKVFSTILDLDVEGRVEQVVLKALQRHPAKPRLLHVDFQRVQATELLRVHVPLHFLGETTAPGCKRGGLLVRDMTEVEVEILPKDLPEHIAVDVSTLELNEAIHLSELQLPPGVVLVALIGGIEHDRTVVSVQPPQTEKSETGGETGAGEAGAGT